MLKNTIKKIIVQIKVAHGKIAYKTPDIVATPFPPLNFSNNGYIEFWLNTYNPSYNNVFPTIFIDGIPQATPMMIGGNPSSFYFMKVQSSNISAGAHTIKIQFVGSYYIFKIDEIDFYEY